MTALSSLVLSAIAAGGVFLASKYRAQHAATTPADIAPSSVPSPIPTLVTTPSSELIAVATRIEERQKTMLQMLEDKFAAFDAKLDALKAKMDDMAAKLVAKDAEVAAATGALTAEQQAEIDAVNAHADEIHNKLDALIAG